ncbi:MAG TPA: C4-type zinc ribbon domain-containing protein [Candidatus Cloacimonadota bacterium]|nr:C4-type zinc ribbon domain-containing protein [Candidatus Cloacimonadota bacterium]
MEEQLRTLARMQLLDDKIGRYKALQDELPKQLNSILEQVEQATANLLATETERAELGKRQRQLEMDIKSHQDQVRKYSTQLSEIKTNKEYKALNSEIAYLNSKISDLESGELELMDEDNAFKARIEEDKKELAKAEQLKREKEGDLRAQIGELETQIEKTKAARNELARTLPLSLVKQYGNMIKNKSNKAVAYAKDGACGGCGFVLRPQIRIELQLRKKLLTCESCGRLLLEQFEDLEIPVVEE